MFMWFQRKTPGQNRNPIPLGGACNWPATPSAPIRSTTFSVCSRISRKSTGIALLAMTPPSSPASVESPPEEHDFAAFDEYRSISALAFGCYPLRQ